ncbi:MAG: PEGA domain-containing protein [Proteobacteria bacterium]|nr:PEGA domain-containing protein [Pseudomonadota bacterium]
MRWFLATSLTVLTLLHAPPLAAEATESVSAVRRSKALFDAARLEYRAGRYRPALELFTRALKLTWRPSIVLNMAQCHRRLGNDEAALAHYREYLAQWPSEASGRAPPFAAEVKRHIAALSARLERDRRAAAVVAPARGAASGASRAPAAAEVWGAAAPSASATQGELWLVGAPSGAWVRIDGELRAQVALTDLRLELTPGDHALEIQAEGYELWRRIVTVAAGQPRRETVTLRAARMPGRLWLAAGIGSASLVLAAEALALYSTAQANRQLRSTRAFETYRARAIVAHAAAGVLAAASAVSWWLFYRAQNASEEPPASPVGPSLSILPGAAGPLVVGQVVF